jgi:histone demethylase JARID1
MHSGGMQSPGFGTPVSPHQTGGMFNESEFGGIDTVAVLGSVDSPMRDSFGNGTGQAGSQDVAQMFDDLTNQGEEEEPKITEGERGEGDTNWNDDEIGLFFDGP